MSILFWSLWITAALACVCIALLTLCRAAADVNHRCEDAMRHCRDTARAAGQAHIPAQRDRRADLPPWLFDADPCAEPPPTQWPDGGAVVVTDWDAFGGGGL